MLSNIPRGLFSRNGRPAMVGAAVDVDGISAATRAASSRRRFSIARTRAIGASSTLASSSFSRRLLLAIMLLNRNVHACSPSATGSTQSEIE